jgi:hypothetical protein
MKFFASTALFILLLVWLALPHPAAGHGFAGARFFPATLSTDDPFVNDELSLPTVSTIETPEGRETAISVEIAKRITPNLGIELSQEFMDLSPKHDHEASGFGNIELSTISTICFRGAWVGHYLVTGRKQCKNSLFLLFSRC